MQTDDKQGRGLPVMKTAFYFSEQRKCSVALMVACNSVAMLMLFALHNPVVSGACVVTSQAAETLPSLKGTGFTGCGGLSSLKGTVLYRLRKNSLL